MKKFTDAIAALEEAAFLAQQEKQPYVIVDLNGHDVGVLSLMDSMFLNYSILEVCRP